MLVSPVEFFVKVINSKLSPGLTGLCGLGIDSEKPPPDSADSVSRLESECDKACESGA